MLSTMCLKFAALLLVAPATSFSAPALPPRSALYLRGGFPSPPVLMQQGPSAVLVASPQAGYDDAVRQSISMATPATTPRRGGAVLMQQGPSPAVLVAAPQAGYDGAVAAGAMKASMPPSKIFVLGVISGAHIAFGAFLMLSVGGACPGFAASNPGLQKIILGAFGLPFGLFMTLMSGAELFTGNTALVTAAKLNGKVSTAQLAKSWGVSYLGNFVGSLLLAALVAAGGTLAGSPQVAAVAVTKTSLPFVKALVRGVLCNWLVCMAVYLASFARDTAGKMVAIWFPISAFVALGLEHSVANMFMIPLAMLQGAAITWKAFLLSNLLPVTLGNIIGGAVCVAGAFTFTYGNKD